MKQKREEFALSDTIRDELNKLKISILDTPNGTLWEKFNKEVVG